MSASPSVITGPITTIPRERAVATLVLAFAADPIIRWFLPHPERYLTFFPQAAQLVGEAAFGAGTAEATEADSGAALWVPPGSSTNDEAVGDLITRSTDAERHPATFAFLELMGIHHPTEPHWYLPFIGVEPTSQGRGLGSRLLAHGLARADEDGLPSYLEASSPRNRALYERHGFVVTAEIQVADSPPLWPMHRPAATVR